MDRYVPGNQHPTSCSSNGIASGQSTLGSGPEHPSHLWNRSEDAGFEKSTTNGSSRYLNGFNGFIKPKLAFSDAKPGSANAPWHKLTKRELSELQQLSHKGTEWFPSEIVVYQELARKGRGQENYERERARCLAAGEPFLNEDIEDLAGERRTSRELHANTRADEPRYRSEEKPYHAATADRNGEGGRQPAGRPPDPTHNFRSSSDIPHGSSSPSNFDFSRVPKGPRAAMPTLPRRMSEIPEVSPDVKRLPHVFISSAHVPSLPATVRHLFKYIGASKPSKVLLDATGYYILFDNSESPRRQAHWCCDKFNGHLLFDEYVMAMECYPHGNPPYEGHWASPRRASTFVNHGKDTEHISCIERNGSRDIEHGDKEDGNRAPVSRCEQALSKQKLVDEESSKRKDYDTNKSKGDATNDRSSLNITSSDRLHNGRLSPSHQHVHSVGHPQRAANCLTQGHLLSVSRDLMEAADNEAGSAKKPISESAAKHLGPTALPVPGDGVLEGGGAGGATQERRYLIRQILAGGAANLLRVGSFRVRSSH